MATVKGRPLHYVVEILGTDLQGQATHVTLSHHLSELSAFGAVTRVLQQWEASHGAVPVGTTVKIKDTRDGGTIWAMTYFGYEQDTLTGR